MACISAVMPRTSRAFTSGAGVEQSLREFFAAVGRREQQRVK